MKFICIRFYLKWKLYPIFFLCVLLLLLVFLFHLSLPFWSMKLIISRLYSSITQYTVLYSVHILQFNVQSEYIFCFSCSYWCFHSCKRNKISINLLFDCDTNNMLSIKQQYQQWSSYHKMIYNILVLCRVNCEINNIKHFIYFIEIDACASHIFFLSLWAKYLTTNWEKKLENQKSIWMEWILRSKHGMW